MFLEEMKTWEELWIESMEKRSREEQRGAPTVQPGVSVGAHAQERLSGGQRDSQTGWKGLEGGGAPLKQLTNLVAV